MLRRQKYGRLLLVMALLIMPGCSVLQKRPVEPSGASQSLGKVVPPPVCLERPEGPPDASEGDPWGSALQFLLWGNEQALARELCRLEIQRSLDGPGNTDK